MAYAKIYSTPNKQILFHAGLFARDIQLTKIYKCNLDLSQHYKTGIWILNLFFVYNMLTIGEISHIIGKERLICKSLELIITRKQMVVVQ